MLHMSAIHRSKENQPGANGGHHLLVDSTYTQELSGGLFPPGGKTNKQQAKGSEVSSVAGPRLEGVTIAEVWYHSQSLPTCQDLE